MGQALAALSLEIGEAHLYDDGSRLTVSPEIEGGVVQLQPSAGILYAGTAAAGDILHEEEESRGMEGVIASYFWIE